MAQSIPSVCSMTARCLEELDQPFLSVERRKELEEKVVEYEGGIQWNKEAILTAEEEIKEREIALRQLNCKYQCNKQYMV